jgi:hypothetical protein
MTGYTVHTGSNDKFRDGWDRIFQSRKKVDKASTRKQSGKDVGSAQKKKQK